MEKYSFWLLIWLWRSITQIEISACITISIFKDVFLPKILNKKDFSIWLIIHHHSDWIIVPPKLNSKVTFWDFDRSTSPEASPFEILREQEFRRLTTQELRFFIHWNSFFILKPWMHPWKLTASYPKMMLGKRWLLQKYSNMVLFGIYVKILGCRQIGMGSPTPTFSCTSDYVSNWSWE